MILPWRVHVLWNDQHSLLNNSGRFWDLPVNVWQSKYSGRNLVQIYPTDEFKTFAKLKYDIIEDDLECSE